MANGQKEKIDFNQPEGTLWAAEEFTGEIAAEDWTELTEVKGVRFRTWKFAKVDSEIIDGALVEVQPGCRTPVQFVATEHTFDEVIQTGKMLLLYLTDDGLSVYRYDSSVENVSFTLRVGQGEIVCLYALKENTSPAEVVETERPGFASAKLLTVETGTKKMNDLVIPEEFWQLISALDAGKEGALPVKVLDLNEII